MRGLAAAGMDLIRAGSSRIFGIALVITSALLFGVAFVTGFLPFELASIVTFALGVSLLAVELEPRVKLSVAADGMLGYVRSLDTALRAMHLTGNATYVPQGDVVVMTMAKEGSHDHVALPPPGDGLYAELAGQLGNMSEKGLEFFNAWLPKALVDDLSAADEVKISRDGAIIKVSMSKPFVRRLCVDPFVNANVCSRMGCPLAGVVAMSLATTSGKDVHFENCSYEPTRQRAETKLSIRT